MSRHVPKSFVACAALVMALSGCSGSSPGGAPSDEAACDAARDEYQERIEFVGDPFDPSEEYRELSKKEQAKYDEDTAKALDDMNRACETGPYQPNP